MQIRRTAAVLTSAAALTFGGMAAAAPAYAAPPDQTGLVNVNIGDITVRDVNVGVNVCAAANVNVVGVVEGDQEATCEAVLRQS